MCLVLPEPPLHFSVIFAIVAPNIGLKRALLISALALIPDLDVLFHIHRSMSHSLFILVLAYSPFLVVTYRFKPEYFQLAICGLLALLSHPVMDCFQTYTPILYPLYDRSVWVNVEGSVLISSSSLAPKVSATVKDVPTVFREFETMDAPLFSSESLIVSIMLIAPTILFYLKSEGLIRRIRG